MYFHIIYKSCQILIVFSIYVQNQINNIIEQGGKKKQSATIMGCNKHSVEFFFAKEVSKKVLPTNNGIIHFLSAQMERKKFSQFMKMSKTLSRKLD